MTDTSPLRLDPADPVHAEVPARLATDHIGWLTTVRDDGNGVVVLSGPAVISGRTATQWLPEIGEACTAKYAEAMAAYGMGLAAIAEKFHVAIELEPTGLQAW